MNLLILLIQKFIRLHGRRIQYNIIIYTKTVLRIGFYDRIFIILIKNIDITTYSEAETTTAETTAE